MVLITPVVHRHHYFRWDETSIRNVAKEFANNTRSTVIVVLFVFCIFSEVIYLWLDRAPPDILNTNQKSANPTKISMHFHGLSETEFQMKSDTDYYPEYSELLYRILFMCLNNIHLWSFELARLAKWSDTSDNTELQLTEVSSCQGLSLEVFSASS